ncbi:mast cell-expressed membrane protein 1 [Tamandua tetradactyla]|uniref:mast cell-expressed membrane protein 1 n=1 Tax=Tamandua tetradactyla TaxID=48850 RepID=UPI004053C09B
MQMANFTNKKRGGPAKHKGADDPDYENITLAFRNQGQPRGGASPPESQVPAQSRPPSDPAQAPHSFHRVIKSLYVLLAVIFIFCIILSALVLVKNTEMTQELLDLKQELWNISDLVRECEKEQKAGKRLVQQNLEEAKSIRTSVADMHGKQNKLQTDLAHIKSSIQKIVEMLEKKMQSTPQ